MIYRISNSAKNKNDIILSCLKIVLLLCVILNTMLKLHGQSVIHGTAKVFESEMKAQGVTVYATNPLTKKTIKGTAIDTSEYYGIL